MGAADDGRIDAIVAALRQDPVLVEQALGNGHTEQAVDALQQRVEDAGFPVYVVLVREPAGLERGDPAGDLLRIVHNRLDEPGLYVVGTDTGALRFESYGAPVEVGDIYSGLEAATPNLPQVDYGDYRKMPKVGDAALVIDIAADDDHELDVGQIEAITSNQALVEHEYPDWEPYEPPVAGDALAWVAGVAVFAGLGAAALSRALATVPKRGRRPTPPKAVRPAVSEPPPDPLAASRSEVARILAAVDRRRGRKGLDPDRADRADLCADLAEKLASRDQQVEVLGALVLARTARALVAGDAPYRPCFFHPGHGEGEHRTRLADASIEVPCCERCDADTRAGRRQDALLVPGWRGRRPYWTRDDVWARTGFGALVDDLELQVQEREVR